MLSVILGTLGASLLGNLLSCKGERPKSLETWAVKGGNGAIQVGEATMRVGQYF